MKTFYLFLITLLPSYSFAQVDWKNLDTDSLNYYILEEVNLLRQKVRAPLLYNDTLLILPAKDHTEYMIQNNVLTHYQKQKNKSNPYRRMAFYKINVTATGENVQNFSYILLSNNQKNNNRDLAKMVVLNWRNSPSHYKNIIQKNFRKTYTYIAISNDNVIYACQVFTN